jgi:3D (Asp-Asp-Asp) domain-containing protein
MLRLFIPLFALSLVAQPPPPKAAPDAAVHSPVGPTPFIATAYATKGNTVKGVQTQPGIVAADPRLLPLGSVIRVTDAGKYSGNYVVTDLGIAIKGARIDVYVMDPREARLFGRKRVTVELVKAGDNVKFQPETSHTIPKSALAPAQKEDAKTIPSNTVPADKPAVIEGRKEAAKEKAAEPKQEEAKR